MNKTVPHIVAVGECMIELLQLEEGFVRQSFGGDTLNTALYLARLGGRRLHCRLRHRHRSR